MAGHSQQENTSNNQAGSTASLTATHRMLDQKITELDGRSFLSAEEHLQLSKLKKEKLRVKDQLAEIEE